MRSSRPSLPYHLFSDHTEFEAMYIKGVHLGQGSYGAAYKVTSRRNKKLFVLKEIIKVATSRKERERDRTEIEILKKCSHENIGNGSFHFDNYEHTKKHSCKAIGLIFSLN